MALPNTEVVALLESLSTKSLVRMEVVNDEARFTLLETIREYALERLAAQNETQAVRWRHASYYAMLVTSANKQNPRWFAQQEHEFDNVRAALGWTVEAREMLPGLLIIGDFWLWSNRSHEGRRWLAMVLERPLPDTAVVAAAWYCAGCLALFNHDYPAARAAFEHCYRIEAVLGRPIQLKYWNLGLCALGEGDLVAAGALFTQFLDEERATLQRDIGLGYGTLALGMYKMMLGDPANAQMLFDESLVRFRSHGHSVGAVDTLPKLGYAAQQQG
jgi:hypothetical protein